MNCNTTHYRANSSSVPGDPIASSYVNNNHGSTLSFATVNPSNTAEYRKFVINQGNWGSRKDFLDFGLSASAADPNPHSSINSTDTVLTLDGNNKRVGIGESDPESILHVQSDVLMGIKKTAATASTSQYNYILSGPRPGTTTSGAIHFINGSGRSTDGGTSTYTMRNDSGNTRVGNSSYSTIIAGAHSFPNRPIAVVGCNNLAQAGQRNTYPNTSGIFVFNTALINSGIYNYSNGRFTAPSGYGGYYLLSFTGLGAYYNTNAPNTRWYVNGSVHNYGAYHTNLSGMSGTPAHVGVSGMHIINLAANQYVDLRVVGGTLYGQSTLHAYTVCLYLGAA